MLDKPIPIYSYDDLEGWYKIKSDRAFGFNGQKIHYFFHSRVSICGEIKDQSNILIRCEDVSYKKCKQCIRVKNTYQDLRNRPI